MLVLSEKIRLVFVVAAMILFAVLVNVAQAATVTDAYDVPSNIEIDGASNHEFNITIADGVTEGQALLLTFPSGFGAASVTEDDVDVADDGVDLTTAPDCSGTEQAGVTRSGMIMIIAICPGDGGAIASGSLVTIEIGLNASASGTGSSRFTNPSDAGTYFLDISSTSGITGSILMPIADPGNAGVVAVVVQGLLDGGGLPDLPHLPDIIPHLPDIIPHLPDIFPNLPDIFPRPDDEEPPEVEPTPEPEPTPGSTGETVVHEASFRLFAANRTIELIPSESTYRAIEHTAVTARVFVDDSAHVEDVSVQYGEVAVDDALEAQNEFAASFDVGGSDATLSIVVDYDNGQTEVFTSLVDVLPRGIVYERIGNLTTPVEGAVVIVYEGSSGRTQWNADAFAQRNPFVTDDSGQIGWYVPNGSYLVTAGRSSFGDRSVSMNVSNNILTPSLELVREAVVPPVEEPTTEPTPESPIPIVDIVPEVVQAINDVIEDLRTEPAVQASADVSTIVATAAVVGSTIILASAFNLLQFIQYLFTAPVLFFARRRREQFGIVYNAFTKVPIDLAIVRLLNEQGRLLQTRVTDKEGRYFFKADVGRFRIEVTKKDFTSPSSYLSGERTDGKFLDVYTGQIIDVTEKSTTIAVNIPIDPVTEMATAPRRLAFLRFFRVLQNLVAIVGIVLSLYALIIQPSWFTAGLFILQLVVYLVVRRLAKPKKRKGWGIVYEKKSKIPIANAVVRLFEPRYNKLLESTITDSQGRYSFMVGPSEYFATVEKQGYAKQEVRGIDYRNKEKPTLVSVNVGLQKQ